MTRNPSFKALVTAAALGALVACGGGGGGGGTTPAPAPDPKPSFTAAELQGRWVTAAGITPAQTAIVLPASLGNSDMSLWLLSSDLQSLAKLQVSTSGADAVSAQGKLYSLAIKDSTPLDIKFSGTANLVNDTLSFNASALQLTRTDKLAGTANLADVAGSWSGSASKGQVKVTLAVANDGALSGSSTPGCTYSGLLTARNGVQVFSATLSETCAGTKIDFSGIATYRLAQGSTPAGLTLALVNADATESSALVMALGSH